MSVQTGLDAARVLVSDGSEERACVRGTACWSSDNGDDVFYFGFTPDQVTVRVLDASDNVLAEFSEEPKYEAERPNGDDCPPVCRRASLVVE